MCPVAVIYKFLPRNVLVRTVTILSLYQIQVPTEDNRTPFFEVGQMMHACSHVYMLLGPYTELRLCRFSVWERVHWYI